MRQVTYQFSIEDFHNKIEDAKNYIIREYAADLMIVAASTIGNGDKAEMIVGNAYSELLKHSEEFHSLGAIKEFLYKRVNDDCGNYLKGMLS